MTRFLIESGISDEESWDFVFIDRVDHCYTTPSSTPITSSSNPNSPFINKSPQEISEMLIQLCKDTKSEILYMYTIVMDERSKRDDTVLLVTKTPECPLEMVRATFGAAARSIILYHTGHRGIEEDQDLAAEDEDGVFRGI
jgi:hypothetical protein